MIEPKRLWDYAGVVEVMIERPASVVWPYFFGEKKEVWAKTRYTPVAGLPGEIGETFSNSYLDGRLMYETVMIQPERDLTLKISYQEGAHDSVQLVGYDFITLRESRGSTVVTCMQAFALPVEAPNADLAVETRKQNEMLSSIFSTLKDLIEKGG